MRMAFVSMFAMFVFGVMSLAQVASEPVPVNPPSAGSPAHAEETAAQPASASELAAGTIISGELSKSLDARKVKANARVEAKTAMDLLSHGQILVPRNTKIIGHVTVAKARSKTSPDSMVGITFDRLLMKDGREVPLQVAVQAIGRPLQLGPSLMGNMSSAENGARMPAGIPGPQTQMGGAPPSDLSYPYPNGGAPGAGLPPDPVTLGGSTVSPLSSASRGVVGIKGLSLETSGQASVVSSNTDNVHLESGTQLILRVQ